MSCRRSAAITLTILTLAACDKPKCLPSLEEGETCVTVDQELQYDDDGNYTGMGYAVGYPHIFMGYHPGFGYPIYGYVAPYRTSIPLSAPVFRSYTPPAVSARGGFGVTGRGASSGA